MFNNDNDTANNNRPIINEAITLDLVLLPVLRINFVYIHVVTPMANKNATTQFGTNYSFIFKYSATLANCS
jgi:hypothetical protein